MRTAIYDKLNTITDLENVYQPFCAPEGASTPYAVIKMEGDDPAVDNRSGSIYSFSVILYDSPDSYLDLDDLVLDVREVLHGVALTTDDGDVFTPEYIRTIPDFYDDQKNLISKIVEFDFAGKRP